MQLSWCIYGLGVCYKASPFTIVMYVRCLKQSYSSNGFHLVGLWTRCTRATGMITANWQIVQKMVLQKVVVVYVCAPTRSNQGIQKSNGPLKLTNWVTNGMGFHGFGPWTGLDRHKKIMKFHPTHRMEKKFHPTHRIAFRQPNIHSKSQFTQKLV